MSPRLRGTAGIGTPTHPPSPQPGNAGRPINHDITLRAVADSADPLTVSARAVCTTEVTRGAGKEIEESCVSRS